MSIRKAAPAGYWAEMILNWLEDGAAQPELFRLFSDALTLLDRNIMDPAVTSILFQVHFMRIAGISPCLTHCIRCCTCLDDLRGMRAGFDPVSGGLVCGDCIQPLEPLIRISQGTVITSYSIHYTKLYELFPAARKQPGPVFPGL